MSAELQEEFRKLNRYCSSYGSSYSSGYSYSNYRPSSYSSYSNYRPSSYNNYYYPQQQQTSPLSGLGSLVGQLIAYTSIFGLSFNVLFGTVKPLIINTSKEFIKCRILHYLIMECCRYLVF